MNNSGATTSPWLTICSSAPWAPWGFSAKIPSVMNPSCATEEYPAIRRASVWLKATAQSRTGSRRARSAASASGSAPRACGYSGSTIARKPYAPTFDSTPREHHQHLDRHRPVSVRHPAVQRERGHLHEERGGEEQEDPLLRAPAQGNRLQRGEHERDVAAALLRGEHAGGDRRGEHQQRAHQRVDHELDRRFHPIWIPGPSPRSGSRTGSASGRRTRRTAPDPARGMRPGRRTRRA